MIRCGNKVIIRPKPPPFKLALTLAFIPALAHPDKTVNNQISISMAGHAAKAFICPYLS